jgi:hypothetical protein
MDYDLADVTHIELDMKLIFEQTIKLFIGSTVVEIISCKKMKDPFEVFAKINKAWIEAKKEKNDSKVLSE